MTLTAWLGENLSAKALMCRPKSTRSIILEAKDKNAGISLEIFGVPDAVTAIHLDRVRHLAALNPNGGPKPICDYLVVTQTDDKCFAIFFDLKRTLLGTVKPREQLRWSLPLLSYLLSAFEVDSGEKVPDSKMAVSYILVGQKSSHLWDKQSVRYDPTRIFETEQHGAIKIRRSVARAIPFSELLGG